MDEFSRGWIISCIVVIGGVVLFGVGRCSHSVDTARECWKIGATEMEGKVYDCKERVAPAHDGDVNAK